MALSKQERFLDFLRRLGGLAPASSQDEAFLLLCQTLIEVENEFSEIPFSPENWQADGRLYPPQADSARDVPGRTDLTRYRHKGHNTWIRDNGAIEIREINGKILFEKPVLMGKVLIFKK